MTRRAFTLLELMLAATLGVVILIASLSLFTVLDRQQKRQQVLTRENMELARTQEAFERSMQLLIMSDTGKDFIVGGGPAGAASAAGAQSAGSGKSGSSGPSGTSKGDTAGSASGMGKDSGRTGGGTTGSNSTDPKSAGGSADQSGGGGIPGAPDPGERPRIILTLDDSQPPLMRTPDGGRSRPQRFEVVLRAPPAYVDPSSLADADTSRGAAVRGVRVGDRSSSPSSSSPRSRRDDRAQSDRFRPGVTTDDSDAAPTTQDWRIADGVRGVFELTQDDPAPDQAEPSWTLWWRPLSSAVSASADDSAAGASATGTAGALLDAAGNPRTPARSGAALPDRPGSNRSSKDAAAPGDAAPGVLGGGGVASVDPSVPDLGDVDLGRAHLASGLVMCWWEVYRERKFIPEYTAVAREALPAYVKMHVQTLTGLKVEWIFEVSWSNGPEPGSRVLVPTVGTVGPASPTTQQPGAATSTPGTTTPAKPGTPGVNNPAVPSPAAPAPALPANPGARTPATPMRPTPQPSAPPARPAQPQPPNPKPVTSKPTGPQKGAR